MINERKSLYNCCFFCTLVFGKNSKNTNCINVSFCNAMSQIQLIIKHVIMMLITGRLLISTAGPLNTPFYKLGALKIAYI